MIPRIVHYCWFGGARRDRLSRRCMRTWSDVLPGFEIKEWNEDNSPLDHPYLRRALAEQRWSKLSNYMRLHALLADGGVYLDTDVEVRRDLTPLLAHDAFAGFQLRPEETDWVNNAVLGATPGHPFVRRCLELTLEAFVERGEFARSPAVTTTALRELGLREYGLQTVGEPGRSVAIYPVEAFSPYSWYERYSADRITPDTYCVHRWAMSWVGSAWRLRLGHALRYEKPHVAMLRWIGDLLDRAA
jgi:hypothetical protein